MGRQKDWGNERIMFCCLQQLNTLNAKTESK